MHLRAALLCRIRLPAGCVGIIEKQFAGEVYGGKVVHLTKPKKKSNSGLEVLEKTCLTRSIKKKKKKKKNLQPLPALFFMHTWLKPLLTHGY